MVVFELKSYIEAHIASWTEPTILREDLLNRIFSCDEQLTFSDADFVALSKEIDKYEAVYYQQRHSISLFLNNILRLLAKNLRLDWAAAQLTCIDPTTPSYSSCFPAILKNKITRAASRRGDPRLVVISVDFCNEHVATFFLHLGPFNPKPLIVQQFAQYVISMIDDFLYSDLMRKRQTYRLKSEIAELTQRLGDMPFLDTAAREEAAQRTLRLAIIGDALISTGAILSACEDVGFAKSKVDLFVEYDKLKSLDTNNLLKARCHYDGLLLGPMPHHMKGTFLASCASLLERMEHEPDRYPPFVAIRDHAGQFKITKTSLAHALATLATHLASINRYATCR